MKQITYNRNKHICILLIDLIKYIISNLTTGLCTAIVCRYTESQSRNNTLQYLINNDALKIMQDVIVYNKPLHNKVLFRYSHMSVTYPKLYNIIVFILGLDENTAYYFKKGNKTRRVVYLIRLIIKYYFRYIFNIRNVKRTYNKNELIFVHRGTMHGIYCSIKQYGIIVDIISEDRYVVLLSDMEKYCTVYISNDTCSNYYIIPIDCINSISNNTISKFNQIYDTRLDKFGTVLATDTHTIQYVHNDNPKCLYSIERTFLSNLTIINLSEYLKYLHL